MNIRLYSRKFFVLLTSVTTSLFAGAMTHVSVAAIVPSVQNVTVTLDGTGNASVTAAQFENGTSTTCSLGDLSFALATTGTVSVTADEGQTLTIQAPAGSIFTSINFASYGTPTINEDGSFAIGSCNGTESVRIVGDYLLGRNSASIPVNNPTFQQDPCVNVPKRLYVTATYTLNPPVNQLAFTGANLGINNVVVVITDACGNIRFVPVTVTVLPFEVRCGNKNDKFLLCHNGQEICVDGNAVAAHLAHGDSRGTCSSSAMNAPATASQTNAAQSASELLVESLPNPTADGQFRVHVKAPNTGPMQVNMFDMQGNLISKLFEGYMQAGEQRDISVNHPELRQGLYLVRVQNGKTSSSARIEVKR